MHVLYCCLEDITSAIYIGFTKFSMFLKIQDMAFDQFQTVNMLFSEKKRDFFHTVVVAMEFS